MRIFVYGSRALRDSFDLLRHQGHSVVGHVTGQSLVPLGRSSPLLEAYPAGPALSSRVQRRSLDGTLRADLLDQLASQAAEIDVLLWDISEEGHDVYRMPDGGYVTRSRELIITGMDRDIAREATLLPSGTDEHLQEWTQASVRWTRALRALGLESRTLLASCRFPEAPGLRRRGAASARFATPTSRTAHGTYRDRAMRALPGMHLLGGERRDGVTWTPPGADDDAMRAQNVVRALDAYVKDPSFALPRPIVEPVSPGRVRVHSEKTWASELALYVFRDTEAIIKVAYRTGSVFDVELAGPGTYQFRVFHRSGDERRAINSAPLTVHEQTIAPEDRQSRNTRAQPE